MRQAQCGPWNTDTSKQYIQCGAVITRSIFTPIFTLGRGTVYLLWIQGAVSIRKTVLPGMAFPMLKIRRPNGRLIFNMEIAIRR